MSLKKSFDFGEINIWQFPVGTTVELKNNFLFFLNRIRKKKFKSIGRLHEATALDIPFLTFKSYLKPSFPNFRDLHVLLKICDCLNIPKDKLQKNISAYQFKKSRITVRCPILPIRVTPLFPMLIAHMIADGNIVRFKNKSTIYFSYRQYNPRLRLLLLEKTMTLFGELHYKEKYFFERTKIYLPVVLTRLLCNYYGFKDSGFLSKSAILPKSIMGSSKPHLLAVLIAFIIDEGHIDSGQIVIKLKNDFLLRQLSEICNKLGYKNSVKPIDKYGMTALYLLKKGVQSFWKEYLDLKRNFPAVDMGYREQKIKSNIRRFQKDWKSRGQNQTKNAIITTLKKKPATVWEIAQELDISRQGIRCHTDKLFSMAILKRKKVEEGAFLYSLKKEIYFEETSKGRSLPIGKTEKELKNLLSVPRTTIELIKATGIEKSAVRGILNRLCEKEEIVLIEKKPTRTVPTKIWQLV